MTTVAEPRLDRRAGPRPGPAARLVWELAGAEGRRLLRHPAFLSLLGLALLVLGGAAFGEEVADVLNRDDVDVSLMLTLVAWGTLLATNLAALRGRRDRAGELYDTLPAPAASRTLGQVLATLAVLPVALALLAGWWVSAELNDPTATVGTPRLAELAVGPLLILGGGATGALIARWLPTVLAGPVAVVVTVVLQSNLGHQDPELRWLHFVADQPSVLDPWLEVRHAGWHAVYLLGLVVLAGTLAVRRHGFPRRLTAVAAAAVAVVLVSGWVQTRPPTGAEVAAVVDRLERPEAHQVCERRAGVRYCASPPPTATGSTSGRSRSRGCWAGCPPPLAARSCRWASGSGRATSTTCTPGSRPGWTRRGCGGPTVPCTRG
jgi:hypothetical protein